MARPYTVKQLTDVEDSAPGAGLGDTQEMRFATGDLDAERTGVAYYRIRPGRRQPIGHNHDEAEEVYVVIGGSGRVKLGDDVVAVEPLQAIRVAPAVIRSFEAGPDGLELLVAGPRHDADGAVFPGWWSD